MTADNFYWYASVLIFVPWAALVFAPNWKWTETLAFACAIILLIAATAFTVQHLRTGNEGGHVFSLDGLKNLFRSSHMVLTGWLNYLSFSLLVGIWESHDARRQKIPHMVVAPCLLLTLLLGPAGLLVYMLLRWVRTRSWEV